MGTIVALMAAAILATAVTNRVFGSTQEYVLVEDEEPWPLVFIGAVVLLALIFLAT